MTERELPRAFPTSPPFTIPLDKAELQELGTFTAIWGQIDFLIHQMITHLINSSSPLGGAYMTIIAENLTTGPRVNILRRFCDLDKKDIVKKKIILLFEKNSGLIENRNNMIHGMWGISWDGESNNAEAASMYDKSKKPPLLASKIEVLTDRAAQFANDLFDLHEELVKIKIAGTKPHRFFFGPGPKDLTRPPPPWPP